MSGGLRVALAGATGTLGSEILAVLEEEPLPLAELQLFAGERSQGQEVEFQGEALPVDSGTPRLKGLDLLIVCTPGGPALELVRLALRAEVACLDCSGSLVDSSDVPLVVSDLGVHDQLFSAPLLTTPTGAALAWALVLSALQREAGLTRVVGTVLHSASASGRGGIEALSGQTIALLSQRPIADSEVFPGQLAFDCQAHAAMPGEAGPDDGVTAGEARLASALRRLLGPDVGLAATSVQVPTFAGEASTLAVETERALAPGPAARVLEDAPGVEVWRGPGGPGMRDVVGRDVVVVGRVRRDGSLGDEDRGLLLWLVADPVRLAASNAVKLARARFARG